MKQHFKNYLKFGILLFGLPLLLTNCEKDTVFDTEQSILTIKHPKIKYFSQETIPVIIAQELNTSLTLKMGKYSSNSTNPLETSFGTILTNVIMQTINDDGIENYTYKIDFNDGNPKTFYNLVLRKNPDGSFSEPYIKQYIMSDAFYDSYTIGDATFSSFEGAFVNYNITDTINIDDLLGSKVANDVPCPPVPIEGDNTSEETNTGTTTGSGGSGGDSSTGDPAGTGPTTGGSGLSCTWSTVIVECNGGGRHVGSNASCTGSFIGATYLRVSCSDGSVTDYPITRVAGNTTNTSDTNCPQDEGEVGVLADSEPPCKNLKKLTDSPTNIATRFNELKNNTGNFEKGFRLDKVLNSLNSQAGDMVSATDRYSARIPTEALTFAVAHNHPNDKDFLFFSGKDILNIVPIINNYVGPGFDEAITFTLFLVANGQTYALKFNDLQSIQNLKDIYNSGIIARDKFHSDVNNEYDKDVNVQTGATTSIAKQQRRLYDFLDSNNVNATFLQATYDANGRIDGWEKINKTTLAKEPCN